MVQRHLGSVTRFERAMAGFRSSASFAVALLLFAYGGPTAASRFDFDATPGRLSKDNVPSHYTLEFDLDPTRDTFNGHAGSRLEAAMSKRVLLTVTALVDEYGQASGIPGIAVLIDKKQVAKTDGKGVASSTWDGEPGKKVSVVLSAPGYVPQTWKTLIALEGEIGIQRYFTPAVPRPIRTGIYKFVGNTPNVDLKEVLAQTEEAVGSQLFRFSCFKKVPFETLQKGMKAARVNVEKIAPKGWRETPLRRTADMIVLGSVAKDEHGYLIETKFVASSGKIIHSQLTNIITEAGEGTKYYRLTLLINSYGGAGSNHTVVWPTFGAPYQGTYVWTNDARPIHVVQTNATRTVIEIGAAGTNVDLINAKVF